MLEIRRRVLSEPAAVWWAGFRSDTYRLQQQGWEIAAEEDIAYNRIRLLLRHRDMKLYALTSDVEYHYRELHNMGKRSLEFHVVMAAPHFQVQRVDVDFANFRQIDAQPAFVNSEIKSIEDFRIFATPLVRTEEIIVDPMTVADMLAKVREMQAPEQQRLRQKQRLEAAREGLRVEEQPRQTFHAQIISINDREYRKAA